MLKKWHQNASIFYLLCVLMWVNQKNPSLMKNHMLLLSPPSSSSFKKMKERNKNKNNNNKKKKKTEGCESSFFFFRFFFQRRKLCIYFCLAPSCLPFKHLQCNWVSSLYLWKRQNDPWLTKAKEEGTPWWPRAAWSPHKKAAIAEQCNSTKPNKHIEIELLGLSVGVFFREREREKGNEGSN